MSDLGRGSSDSTVPELYNLYRVAEYQDLRQEISHYHSQQMNLIQIHVTALTLLFAGSFANTLSHWIVVLIPVESFLIGSFYLELQLYTRRTGDYIYQYHETSMQKLFPDEPPIRWEGFLRKNDPGRKKMKFGLGWGTRDWAFTYPGALSTVLLGLIAITCLPGLNGLPVVGDDLVSRLFPVSGELEQLRGWFLFIAALIGGGMGGTYQKAVRDYWNTRNARAKELQDLETQLGQPGTDPDAVEIQGRS